jgi:hypothetical protein
LGIGVRQYIDKLRGRQWFRASHPIDLSGHDDGTLSHSSQQLAAHGMVANKTGKAA